MKIAYNPKTAAALTTAPANNDITFDLSGLSIYVKGVRFKGTDTTYSVFKKHGSSGGGYDGLVPVPNYNNDSKTRFLREDGTWVIPTDSHYTTHLYVGAQSVSNNNNSNASTTNGNTYIKLFDNSTLRHLYLIKGSGNTTVNSDTNGNITINSPTTISWGNVTGKPGSFTPETHYHNLLTNWSDTRAVATIPNDYNAVASSGGVFKVVGIKTAGTLGLTSTLVGNYATVIGWRGWSEKSGGYAWEIASTDKNRLYVRSGSETTWNNGWSAIAYTTDNFPTSQINKLTGYTIATSVAALATTDTLNVALGKLEYKLNIAYDLVTKANDNDGTIENLKEILDVLSGISDTETILGILGNYVTLNTNLVITGVKTFNAIVHLLANQYTDSAGTGSLNLNNSDIYGVNSIKFADLSDGAAEGLQWYRDSTHVDSIWVKSGVIYFTPNREWGKLGTNYTLAHSGNGSTYFTAFSEGGISSSGNILSQANHSITIGGQTRTAGSSSCNIINSLSVSKLTSTPSTNLTAAVTVNGVASADKTLAFLWASAMEGFFTQDPAKAVDNTDKRSLRWFVNVSLASGYAGNNYGFPVSNNANGILYLGTHNTSTDNTYYGGQLGVSSNGRLYYRFNNGSTWSTAANGGSWKTIAWTSDNVASATKLQTARTIWGQSFDGTANVKGSLTDVTSITASGIITTTGSICVNGSPSESNNYNEGIRCNLGGRNNWASLVLGGASGSTSGSGDGIYSLLVNSKLFRIRQNSTEVLTINTSNNVGIGTTSPAYKLHVAGQVAASGFIKAESSDSYVLLGGGGHKLISDFMLKTDELSNNLTTITKTFTVTLAWMDTGITSTDLPANGTYIVLVYVNANDGTGSMYRCYNSGVMSWFKDSTNDTEADEIILHRSGHAYLKTIYLRTVMLSSGVLKLLIGASSDIGKDYTYTFKFKRII